MHSYDFRYNQPDIRMKNTNFPLFSRCMKLEISLFGMR